MDKADVTVSGVTKKICAFIDPKARHPLVMGMTALSILPFQLINEITREQYIQKPVRFHFPMEEKETQTDFRPSDKNTKYDIGRHAKTTKFKSNLATPMDTGESYLAQVAENNYKRMLAATSKNDLSMPTGHRFK